MSLLITLALAILDVSDIENYVPNSICWHFFPSFPTYFFEYSPHHCCCWGTAALLLEKIECCWSNPTRNMGIMSTVQCARNINSNWVSSYQPAQPSTKTNDSTEPGRIIFTKWNWACNHICEPQRNERINNEKSKLEESLNHQCIPIKDLIW